MNKTMTRLLILIGITLLASAVLRAQTQPFTPKLYKTLLEGERYKVWIQGAQTFKWSTGATTTEIYVDQKQLNRIKVEVVDSLGIPWTMSFGSEHTQEPVLRAALPPCGLGWGYQNPICTGGSVTLQAGNGTETGYSYSWSTGATTKLITAIPNADGSSTYSVTVTKNDNTCQDINTSAPIQIYSVTDITASAQWDCTPGNMTLSVVVSNNPGGLQYSLNGIDWQSSSQFTNKSGGIHRAYIKGNYNCITSFQKNIPENGSIELEPRLSNLGDCTLGNVELSFYTIKGIKEDYLYRLNGGSWTNNPSYFGLSSGQYVLEAKPHVLVGGGTCIYNLLNFVITETNGVSLNNLSLGQLEDCTLNNATITAAVNQPSGANVEYRLNGGAWQTSNQFTGLGSGTYTVDIRSTAGCPVSVSTLTRTLTETIYPKLQSIQISNDRDCTNGNVQLQAVLQNPSIPAQYRLNGGAWTQTPSFTGLVSGNYTIEVCPTSGSCICPSSLSVQVQELGQVNITGATTYNVTDCALNNIMIAVQHNAQTTAGLQFRINGGAWQSSTWFKDLSAGSYTIEGQVVGDEGCTFSIPSYNKTLTEASGNTVVDNISLSNHTDCAVNNARIQVNLKQAATAEYRLVGLTSWQSSNVFTNRSTGTYIIEVRPTSNTCTERDTLIIDEKTAVIGTLTVTGLDDCPDDNVRVEIPVTGTAPNASLEFRLRASAIGQNTAWQSSNVFVGDLNVYNTVQVKTSSGCIFSKSVNLFEVEPLAVTITGLTYTAGRTDCIKGNTQISIVTETGEGVGIHYWRINGGVSQVSPSFNQLFGRDSIYVEVAAFDANP